MALRSVLRKMPALGLRSPPMGPLMGPVRVLSPAAGSRLMSSDGAQIEKLERAMKEYQRELALSNTSIDETLRLDHQAMMKKFDIADKASGVVLMACPVAVAALMMINYMM
nr:uncharacterized protein LOC127330940 [Lolium perenne]